MFNFDSMFEIHDDIEVLKRMGMACGLEVGKCSPEDLKVARSLVPKALEPYVIGKGHYVKCSTHLCKPNAAFVVIQRHASEKLFFGLDSCVSACHRVRRQHFNLDVTVGTGVQQFMENEIYMSNQCFDLKHFRTNPVSWLICFGNFNLLLPRQQVMLL